MYLFIFKLNITCFFMLHQSLIGTNITHEAAASCVSVCSNPPRRSSIPLPPDQSAARRCAMAKTTIHPRGCLYLALMEAEQCADHG